ncbi:hypothetical protein GW17_00046921 [Ensete ventricosum]|nr:hypothetical protein GW17_00046921 [Ensete ventricosum]
MESPMNLVNAYVMETRSLSVNLNFLKASRYKMSVELLVSTMILLTQVFAISAEITKVSSWPADNNIDLFLDGSLGVRRGILGGSTVIIGEWLLVSDIPTEVSLPNEVFDLVFEVVAFLRIMSVLSMEMKVSSFVMPSRVCFDWVREPEEPLSILLLGGPEGCPRDCSVRGRF